MKAVDNLNIDEAPAAADASMGVNKKVLVVAAIVLVAVLAAVGGLLGHFLSRGARTVPSLVPLVLEIIEDAPKVSCSNDGFESLRFNNTHDTHFYLKYKILPPSSFVEAYKKCETFSGATLWQVLQGEPEWNEMLAAAKSANAAGVWINADAVGDCPDLEYHCLEDEALFGNGIGVRYSLNEKASYSRLYRVPSSDSKCIHSENEYPNRWTTDSCTASNKTGVCVKRNCLQE